ncbi:MULTISPECIES: hypothetical protein [Mycobacteriaceae]|uniref:Uncharacterized protein n=1 Tax=Mycolicibacterium mucogenicum DSM 44124 TaxID=1226753 RepID=A0A8H2JEK8_MYCMU|nr:MULTISPECIES: hypothetical protein [Mycobacteriaceae]KAB7760319.1 hypothetical protein MMUC44124_07925 [Mycolicibacterium mucogenicum DSM 44124]QPG67862.1 hypothetical protein C1S78_020360 [Mycolicibacterium mucogenicum DSM 44124]
MEDTELLSEWAARAGMLLHASDTRVVHGWAGMEIGYEVRRDGTGYLVVKTDRGNASTRGRFDSLSDADAYVLMCLGSIWRADHGLGDIFPAGAAEGFRPKHDASGWSVEVAGRRAVFTYESDAGRYTHVAGKGLGNVAALMQA